jgi:hypothetical protein
MGVRVCDQLRVDATVMELLYRLSKWQSPCGGAPRLPAAPA